jgi:hypothetical protein
MPVPLAPQLTFADDEQARLASSCGIYESLVYN